MGGSQAAHMDTRALTQSFPRSLAPSHSPTLPGLLPPCHPLSSPPSLNPSFLPLPFPSSLSLPSLPLVLGAKYICLPEKRIQTLLLTSSNIYIYNTYITQGDTFNCTILLLRNERDVSFCAVHVCAGLDRPPWHRGAQGWPSRGAATRRLYDSATRTMTRH